MKKTFHILIVLILIIFTSLFIACPDKPDGGDGGDGGDAGGEYYSLTINIDPNEDVGSVGLDPQPNGDGQYASGTEVTLTATVTDTAYKFVKWYGNVSGVTTNSEITIVMNSNKMVTAKFSDDTTPPSPVTGIVTTPGWQEVKLEWDDPADTDLSHINVTWTPDAPDMPTPVPAGGETITINGLQNDMEYTFSLTALDDAYNESTPETVNETPHLDPPAVPTNVFASPGYNLTIKLFWDEVPDADYYIVRFANDFTVPDTGTPGEDFGEIIVSDGDTEELFWVDADGDGIADPDSIGSLFSFRVQAVNEAGSSDFSPNSHPTTDDTYAYIGYVYRINVTEDDTASVTVDPDQKSYYNTDPYDVITLTPNEGTNGGIWMGWSGIDYDKPEDQGGYYTFTMDESLSLTANFPIPQQLTVDEGVYTEGDISYDDSYDLYYFEGTPGHEYRIMWDDNSLAGGSGTYTADVVVAAYEHDTVNDLPDFSNPYLNEFNDGYVDYGYGTTIQSATIPAGQTKVFISVKPLTMQWNGDDWGDYGIQILDISAPDINLKDPDSNDLASGETYVHPVSIDASNGVTTDFVFTIENLGSIDLDLEGSPYVEEIGGDPLGNIEVTQQPTIDPIPATTGTDTFTITYTGDDNEGTRFAEYSIDTDDPDEDPYTFTIELNAEMPYSEVNLKDPTGNDLASGGLYNSGIVSGTNGDTTDFTFTIENLGTATSLNITGLSKTGGSHQSMFSIINDPTGSNINAGDSATFTIRFTADGNDGTKGVTFTLDNNETGHTGLGDDTDEQAYVFTINVDADSSITFIDNFNSYTDINDMTSTGDWTDADSVDDSWENIAEDDGDPILDDTFDYDGGKSVRLGGDKESENDGGLDYNQISYIEIDVDFASLTDITFEFKYWTSAESEDELKFWIDLDDDGNVDDLFGDEEITELGGGISTGWETASISIGDGVTPLNTKTIRIYYEKDFGYTEGDDVVWVDYVYWY
jgi:hypothetical protein